MPTYIDKTLIEDFPKSKVIIFATNGSNKKDGSNVMGKGVGLSLANLLPNLPKVLGTLIKEQGNHCQRIKLMTHTLISFPTKHNYWGDEDLNLIRQSVSEILSFNLTNDIILMEYPLLSKQFSEDVREALAPLGDNVCIYLK